MSNEKLLINDHKSNNSEVMRNKQIEEMARDIPQRIVAYDRDPNGQYLYTEQRLEIAEILVNADYLKQSEVVKEVLEKAASKFAGHSDYHGETILQVLYCMAEGKEVDNAKPLDAKQDGPFLRDHENDSRWIKSGNEKKCSNCQFIYYSNNDEWTFCPNCGAKMKGGGE
jgi:hypothetical protein